MFNYEIAAQQSSGSSSAGDRERGGNDVMAPLKVDTSGNITNEGPPTPTHSESQDCIDARKCKYIKHRLVEFA